MSPINAPLFDLDDERTPVTVWLMPGQAARLELLLAHQREADPAMDENATVDAVFGVGLMATELASIFSSAATAPVKPGVTAKTPAAGDACLDSDAQAPARPENAPSAEHPSLRGEADGGDGFETKCAFLEDEISALLEQRDSLSATVHQLMADLRLRERDLAKALQTVEAMAAEPLSTPTAIYHLQEVMRGTAAVLRIADDETDAVAVQYGSAHDTVMVYPEDAIELLDALTVIQNLREEVL